MEDNLLTGFNRSDIMSFRQRFRLVMKYVLFCYDNMLNENTLFNKKEWAKTAKDNKFEDYLRERLLEDFLETDKYKQPFLSKNKASQLNDIYFSKESEETYTDGVGLKGKNKNDIYVLVTNLKRKGRNSMEQEEADIYGVVKSAKKAWFQIECKILDGNSTQNNAYIQDIFKYIDRKYDIEAMPFGGQIAFVEKGEMDTIYTKINEKLTKKIDIKTSQTLTYFEINTTFPYSYQSIHTHRLGHKFDIYHLLLDYRNMIKD